MKRFLAGLMVVMAVTAAWGAPQLRKLPWQEAVGAGATHSIEFTYADLTGTATNTATTFYHVVPAGSCIEFRGMVLNMAFDSSTVTNPFSMTVSCGITNAVTKWVNAKQVAYDGTEILSSLGTDYTSTTTLTSTPTLYSVELKGTNVTATVVTNMVVATTGTVTMTSPLLNEQASAVTLATQFSEPGANRRPVDFDRGKLTVYYRILMRE